MTVMTKFPTETLEGVNLPQIANNTDNAPRFDQASVHVVVPCYNEEKRLDGQKFVEFAAKHGEVCFVFVDDGSVDGTLEVLRGLQRRMANRIDVLALPQNAGKAEAVRAGLRHATGNGADLVAYWDADLATPLAAILDFSDIATRYCDVDVVFGSRIQLLGHRISRTLARRAVSRICSGLARAAVRLPVRDTQCGAKLLRNTPALRNAIACEFTAGWLFDVELFTRLSTQMKDRHSAFFEYPLPEWTEVAGSKVNAAVILKSGFKMLKLLAESRFGRASYVVPATITTSKISKLAA